MLDSLIVRPEKGLGDAIMLTGVVKSLEEVFPQVGILASVSMAQSTFLQGRLKKYTDETEKGRITRILPREYEPESNELLINLQGYLDGNTALTGKETLTDSQVTLAEKILRKKGIKVQLPRNAIPQIRFDNVPEYSFEIERGREKVRQMKKAYGEKPIIWLGATTAGSSNRMPQSYAPYRNFWQEIVERLQDKFILYELRSPNRNPIAEGVEPNRGENYHLAAQSEIFKATSAGIGVSGMHLEFAHALGKPRMVILVGPTHPAATVYQISRETMTTMPEIDEPLLGCRGCGMLGYASPESFQEKEEIMKQRFLGFKFDTITKKAIETHDVQMLNSGEVPLCRIVNLGEKMYDCWSYVSPDKVAKKIIHLLQ